MSSLKEISAHFLTLRAERESEAKDHEISRSWEMSYISLWSILEDGLKLFATLGVRAQLHKKVIDWNEYLSGTRTNRPKDIRNFTTEYKSQKIPDISMIEEVLGTMPEVRKIIEPKKKWRNRRNEIAHKASKFKNEALFIEYKNDLHGAVSELEKNITNACTRTK